ncbi:MAG TPA: UbiA family prenyltransferase, partial [Anaerolineales bacterium]|nr:UbiA family prenyltransferase [Anaerolineales bacterium]
MLLTIAGRVSAVTGIALACGGQPFCIPAGSIGWIKLVHIGLAGLSAVLISWLFFKAWNEQRDDQILLPLTTVVTVLFFGQAFVGAMQVIKGFPLHLVVLHTLTAILLWISLVALVVASGLLAHDGKELPHPQFSRRASDFLILSKPWIVVLLLVTTFGGLVVGGKAWPSPALAFWTMLGGAMAAAGSSALNQYIDRELDKNMQRTANRPLAAGRMTAAEGLSYGLALCLISYYLL